MSICATCAGKGYTGLKKHETIFGPPTDRPCPDCGGTGVAKIKSASGRVTWRDESGVVHISGLVSDGTDGEEWIERLEKRRVEVSGCAKMVLRSSGFRPTNGVRFNIVVLVCRRIPEFTSQLYRNMQGVRAVASRRGYSFPPVEVACLLGERFADGELIGSGLDWVITMHKPIHDLYGPSMLVVQNNTPAVSIDSYSDDDVWESSDSFAFIDSN